MVLESTLAYYGVFGLWTASNISLIWWLLKTHREDKKEFMNIQREDKKEVLEVVSNNNQLISILNERLRKC